MAEERTGANLDRRAFLKGSAAATAALGALSLVGCSENKLKTADTGADGAEHSDPGAAFAANEEGAEWFATPCWNNCGSRCLNKVLLKDCIVMRQKTDDNGEDKWEDLQARACMKGYAQQQRVFGADRIKYPMKRKNWSPDSPNGQLRGIDEWERITWDEAIGYIAGELKKAKEKYGNRSILHPNQPSYGGFMSPVLSAFGGYVDVSCINTMGTFQYAPDVLCGLVNNNVNDRFDLVNADYVVLYGMNLVWSDVSASAYFNDAIEKGVKFLFVGPEFNPNAGICNAKWFPVRSGSDTAFLLGVAHSMLAQDDNGSLIDWDFLDKYTVGFDSEHMPADAISDENFVDYVMGKYDGVEKTPEWASKICGCPAEAIEEYARIMGKANNVRIQIQYSCARNKGAENVPQAHMTIAAMGGHFGKPGNACGTYTVDGGPSLCPAGFPGHEWYMTSAGNPVDDFIPSAELWSAVLEGKYHNSGNVLVPMTMGEMEERDIDIHVIINESANYLQSQEGISKGIEAYRKVDFACTQAFWLNTTAKYCDVVLPVTTRWETLQYNSVGNLLKRRDTIFAFEAPLDPLYEAKGDYEIARLLADALGVDISSYFPYDKVEQTWYNCIAGSTVMNESGEYVPLVTITEEHLKKYGEKYGIVGEPQQGVVDMDTFLKEGVYRVKRENGFGSYIAYADFIADPEANPLGTTSGKFEIYSTQKSQCFDRWNKGWPHYTAVSPLPKYLPTVEGWIESYEDFEGGVKGPYPYLVSNTHYLRRAHTDFDNLPWLREAMTQPIFISQQDAKEKGVETGTSSAFGTTTASASARPPSAAVSCLVPWSFPTALPSR